MAACGKLPQFPAAECRNFRQFVLRCKNNL